MRFPSLLVGQKLEETWNVLFEPVGGGSSDVRCVITTIGAEHAIGLGTTEMDAALEALSELRGGFEDRDEGLISRGAEL